MTRARSGEVAAVISLLAAHREILFDLAEWEPVGSIAESVRAALGGASGLGRDEIERLTRWSGRWSQVDAGVRRFYRIALREIEIDDRFDRQEIERAIWRLVEPATDRWVASFAARRHLERIHERLLGRRPGTDLLPRLAPLPSSEQT